ncbi:hypothetical protein D3C71_1164080 [compost metagenome]
MPFSLRVAKFSVLLATSCDCSALFALAQASLRIKRFVRLFGKIRFGPLVLTCTVSASTFFTSATDDSSDLSAELGACARCSENTTSSAVSSAPSWNLTPGRSLNSHTVGSAVSFHEVASAGCSLLSAPRRISGS